MATGTEKTTRLGSIDVWRGIACLMVVVDHAGFALNGSEAAIGGIEGSLRTLVVGGFRLALGPPIFFVISGYCVATSIASARRKGTTPWAFLGRRFWRIVPTYWVALIGFVAVIAALDLAGSSRLYDGPNGLGLSTPSSLTRAQWIGNITLTETWRPFYLPGSVPSVFTRIAWTLCYQEQFYAVSALVWALFAGRWFRGLGIVTIGCAAVSAFFWDTGAQHRVEGLFLDYWHEFAVGLAVYWRLERAETTRAKRGIELGLLALAIVAAFANPRSTVVAALFGLILIRTQGWNAKLDGIRALNPIRACGRRCYSIYLVHLPFCAIGGRLLIGLGLESFWARSLIVIPAVSAVSVAMSWAFYAVIETKFIGTPKPGKFATLVQHLILRPHRSGSVVNA